MSMSDAALVALRELYRSYDSEHFWNPTFEDAIKSLERYCVLAETPLLKEPATPEQIDRAIEVLDNYIRHTLNEWSDNVQSRLDDFNVIAHGLFTGTNVELTKVESGERES